MALACYVSWQVGDGGKDVRANRCIFRSTLASNKKTFTNLHHNAIQHREHPEMPPKKAAFRDSCQIS